MARNGSGTMAVINTMVPGNTITAAEHNENYEDIADEITNSLALDGQSVMTGQMKSASGSVSAPGITFGADLDSGFYRIGANNIGAAVNGTKILDIGTSGLTVVGTITGSFPDGSVSAPGINFASDTDCGLYRIGSNNIGVAVNGAKVLDIGTSGLSVTGTLQSSGALTVATGGLTVTAGGLTVTAGGFTLTAGTLSLPSKSVASAALPNGTIVNRAYSQSATATESEVLIPRDDTVPTSSEGVEAITGSITTASATNRVRVTCSGFAGVDTGDSGETIIFAIFHGTTCIQVQAVFALADDAAPFCIVVEHVPGSAASQSYSMRFGPPSSARAQINGNGSGRLFGGAAKTTMVLEEIQAA